MTFVFAIDPPLSSCTVPFSWALLAPTCADTVGARQAAMANSAQTISVEPIAFKRSLMVSPPLQVHWSRLSSPPALHGKYKCTKSAVTHRLDCLVWLLQETP